MLAEEHPDLFAEAVKYEQEHSDGREYTWTEKETLLELLARKETILSEHEESLKKIKKGDSNQSLSEALEKVLDNEDDSIPCLACHV